SAPGCTTRRHGVPAPTSPRSCRTDPAVAVASEVRMGEPFRIVVLMQHLHDLGPPDAGGWDRLQGLDLAEARMVIEAEQIQAFRSADWSFVLTQQVSRGMEERFGEWLDELTILKAGF